MKNVCKKFAGMLMSAVVFGFCFTACHSNDTNPATHVLTGDSAAMHADTAIMDNTHVDQIDTSNMAPSMDSMNRMHLDTAMRRKDSSQ